MSQCSLLKEIMKLEKDTLLMNVCVATLSKFSAVHNNLPLIYAFMKESPMGFWVYWKKKKLLYLKKQGAEKSDRQRQQNGGLITNNHAIA